MAKNKVLITIIIVTILGLLAFQLGLLDVIFYGSPTSCTANPEQKNCFCIDGEVKVSSFDHNIGAITSDCVEAPVLPALASIPIETWEESITYAESFIFPDQTPGTVCTGELGYTNLVSGVLPVSPDGFVQIRCTEITGVSSGRVLYEMVFRPVDSCILSMTCADLVATANGLDCIPDIGPDPLATTCPLA